MNLQETIRRILREELYSPAGEEHIPGRFVVHKSNPVWRENIELTGLQTSVGECYQQHIGGDVECKESIFATDSLNKKDMFDSTYDDDTWLIDTECAGVTWYKDRHFDNGDYKHHIVTFENISPDCLKLIYKGTGSSEDNIQETIRRVLREETEMLTNLTQLKRRIYLIDDVIKKILQYDTDIYGEGFLYKLIHRVQVWLHGQYFVYSELPDEEWEKIKEFIKVYIIKKYKG